MRYSDVPAPPELRHWVKLAWTLELDGDASATVRHVATPDGCIEIIRRLRGRSFWKRKQPGDFVAGLIRQPAELQLSGDGIFIGVRIWPWAWNAIGSLTSPHLVDDWSALGDAAPRLCLPDDAHEMLAAVGAMLPQQSDNALVEAILASHSVAELAQRSGRSHRWLQRWFERNVGVAPGTYLRLVRFSETFSELPSAEGSLAHHAAKHGFADQAHMSREFRAMAGSSAGKARKVAVGPFLSRDA